jgi:DNA-binding transcriptional regulator LsrR (DeoR family)
MSTVTGQDIRNAEGCENAIVVQLGSGRITNPDVAKANAVRAHLASATTAEIHEAHAEILASDDEYLKRIALPVFDEVIARRERTEA